MLKIYQKAKAVLIWLGPDTHERLAKVAHDSILTISDFLRPKLGVSLSALSSFSNVYQKLVFKNREELPLPNEYEFSTDAMWKSLNWFYSHPYFTRVWVIPEISANKQRLVHCGHEKIEWDRVDLVAGYVINTNNGDCIFRKSASRTRTAAAFVNFQTTDVLLYTTGNDKPSWIPRWDRPMLFRNPFRLGSAVPWETKSVWKIDRKLNILFLTGFVVDPIEFAESYNEGFFGNAMAKSNEGRKYLEANLARNPKDFGK
ncbi:MAG: hypothetical protein MMC33_005276 [Icmadophila ericetorum]|nr:hypothetical protein [Icmadophila ericetorum]